MPEAARPERADLGDPGVVTIDVHDAQIVEKGGLGDEQIGYRRAVPHSVVMSEVTLEATGSIEKVRGCIDDLRTLGWVILEPMGLNPFRVHRRRPSDYLLVGATLAVTVALVLWALL